MRKNPQELTEKLGLEPHPEGGFYKQTYRSDESIPVPDRYEGDTRSTSTQIYYMLTNDDFSAWHRIKSDEIWHHYDGSPLKLSIISPDGELSTVILGNPIDIEGAVFQYCVPHGHWFAAEVYEDQSSYALMGCSVSPGFDYKDWELGDRNNLLMNYPLLEEEIVKYTRLEADEPAQITHSMGAGTS